MGKLRIIGLSFILVFFLNSCSAQKDINIESREIMSTINSKTTAIETFKAKFAIQVEKGGEESLTKGELIFKKPNKSNMKGSTIVARGRETRSIEQIMVSDGKILWQYMPALRMAMKLHITSKSSPPVGFEVVNPFFGVEPASIVYKGIEKIDEKEFYIYIEKWLITMSLEIVHL
jgi:outer membrane lipoprotein-sorting protein